jgi:hypothetical protein
VLNHSHSCKRLQCKDFGWVKNSKHFFSTIPEEHVELFEIEKDTEPDPKKTTKCPERDCEGYRTPYVPWETSCESCGMVLSRDGMEKGAEKIEETIKEFCAVEGLHPKRLGWKKATEATKATRRRR